MVSTRFHFHALLLAVCGLVGVCASPRVRAVDEENLITIQPQTVYVTVDGDPVTGRDLIDAFVEEHWEKELEAFVQHALIVDELQESKITVSDEDADAELKFVLKRWAEELHMNPNDITPEMLVKKYGLPGGVLVLRRQTRESLGMLRFFQQTNILPKDAHTTSSKYREALQELLEKQVSERGVIRDEKKLGGGEAVRIGGKGYSRTEVRDFIAESQSQVPEAEFKLKLEVLKLERIIQHVMAAKKLELSEKDLEFHYSFLCHQMELKPPFAPGRMVMQQTLASKGVTPQQFIHDRVTRTDATLTKLARATIGFKDLQDEFKNNPQRYKRSENLIAHIFIRVLDPEGRPYTPAWKIPGNPAINSYVGQRREEQFAAAKQKIEALVEAAKIDFDAAAKKSSDDSGTAPVGGKIGRIGAESILFPPCDVAIRDIAVKLKPGEMSAPVRSDYGWHLVKCLDRQDVTYDEAEQAIYVNLIHDFKEKLVKDLVSSAKVEDKSK